MEMRIEELTEQNMRLKDKLVEARESGKKIQQELIQSQRKFSEIDSWNNDNQVIRDNIIKKLQEEKEELDREVTALKKDLETINLVNNSYDADNRELSRELSKTKQELEECRENFNLIQKENESLRQDLLPAAKKIEMMRRECAPEEDSGCNKSALLHKLDGIRDQLRAYRENCSGLENEVKIYKEKVDFCNEKLKANKVLLKELKESSDVMQTENARLQCQLSETQIKLAKSEANVEKLKEENQKCKERKEKLEMAISDPKKDGTSTMKVFSKPEKQDLESSTDVSYLQQQIKDLERELSLSSGKLSETEADLYGTHAQVEQLNLQLKESLDKIAELESLSGRAVTDGKVDSNVLLQQAKRQSQEVRFTLQRKEKESKDLEDKLKETREEMHKMEIQTNIRETQISQLTNELEHEREKFLKLQEEYSAFQRSILDQRSNDDYYKKEIAEKDAIIAEQKVIAANMELKYDELSEQHAAIEELHKQYRKEIQEYEDDLLQTQKDMSDMQVDFKVAENEKEDLNQQLQTANKTITDLRSELGIADQGIKEKEHEISLMTQRLTRMEEHLEEASKSKSKLELQLHESNANAKRQGDEDNIVQNQMEELQTTCEGLRQQVAENEMVAERLRDEISSLETDVSTLKTELQYKDSLNETSTDELKRLALRLKNSEEEITRLTDLCENMLQEKSAVEIELSVANKEIESMENNLKEHGEKENNLVKTLQEERNKFVYKETDMTTYRSKIASLELQCDGHVKEKDELRRKNEDLDDKAVELKSRLEEILRSCDQAVRRRMELEEKVLEIQQDLEESRKTRTQQEEELQNLCYKVAKYEVEIESLKRQNEELKENVVEANIQVVNQREELLKLEIAATEHQKIRESVESGLEQKAKDYEDVQTTVKGLQAELNKVKKALITSKMSHEFALDENSRLSRKMQEQENKLALLEKEVSEANEENKKWGADLECQTAKLNNQQLQLASASREKERIKDDLQTSEKKLQKIQEELLLAHNKVREKERIVESYRVEICEKDSQIERLKSMKESFEEKNLALKKELQTTVFYYESNESKRKGAHEEIVSLKQKLSQYETVVNTLVKERDNKEKTNEDSNNERQSDLLLQQSRERQVSLEKEVATNKAKISKMENDLKTSRQDCLHSQIEQSKSQRLFEDLKVSYELCDQERRVLREKVLEVNTKISDLELKYESEHKDNLILQSQLGDATSRGDSNRNEILRLSKQCVEQKIRLDAAKKESEHKNRQIEELKADKLHLEQKTVELTINLTSAIGDCEKLRGGHQQLQEEIIVQQKTAANLNNRLQKAMNAERAVQEDLKLKDCEIESLIEELAEVNKGKIETKNKEKRLENTINKQREDLNMAENQITQLQDEILQNRKELGSRRSETAELKANNISLKEELEQNKDALKKLKIELQSVQENMVVVNSSPLQSSFCDDDFEEESEVLQMKGNLRKVEANLQKSIERENDLNDQLESLRNTSLQMQNSLQSMKEREEALKEKGDDAEREFENVKGCLKKCKEDLNTVNSQLEMTQKKVDQLEAQNKRLDDAKKLLMEELKSERGKTIKVEDELLDVQCKLQELQTKWDHNEREADGNENVLDTVKSEKRSLEKDIRTLRDELSSAHALMNNTLKKNRELDAENFQLKKSIAEHETKENGHEQELEELREAVAQHQKLAKDFQLQLQQKRKEMSALSEELENEHQKLTSAKNDYDNLLKHLSQCKGEEENYKKNLSEKDARIMVLENAKTNLEAALKSEVLRNKEAKDEFDQTEQKQNGIIQEKDNRISELEYSIAKVKERNKKLQVELEEINASSSDQTSALQDTQKEIKNLNGELRSQVLVVTALKAKNAALDEEKHRLKEEISKLKRQCSEQTIQLDALKHENERLQRMLNEAHALTTTPMKRPQIYQNTAEPDLDSRKKLVELESAYQNIVFEKEELESKNRSLRERYVELEQETNEYLTAKDSLEKENAWKGRRILELEDSLHNSEYSAQLDRNELEAAVKAKNEIEVDLNLSKNSVLGLEECNITYEETIRQLEDKIAEIQDKNAQLENELEDSQRKLSSQVKELLEMQRKVSGLENTRQSNARSNDELLRDLQSNKNKIVSLENQLCASAREQAKTNLTLKETWEQNAALKKELQQMKSLLREERHDCEMKSKEIREKEEVLKKIQRENRELEDEISAAGKELSAKTTELLTLINKQEETQEEVEALKTQIPELESSWMNEKSENEKLRLEMSASRRLYNDLRVAYENIIDEVNNSQEELGEQDSKQSVQLQKLTIEKEQLNKQIQLLNKRIAVLKENNEKTQREKKEIEQKCKVMRQRLLVFEADEKTIDTITTLQRELEESKQKIHDLNAMYEAIRVERDNIRSEKAMSISPRSFGKHEARPTASSVYLDTLAQKTKIQEQTSPKKDVFASQARAMLLEEKLRIARGRLEGLKTLSQRSEQSDSLEDVDDAEGSSDVFTDEDEEDCLENAKNAK